MVMEFTNSTRLCLASRLRMWFFEWGWWYHQSSPAKHTIDWPESGYSVDRAPAAKSLIGTGLCTEGVEFMPGSLSQRRRRKSRLPLWSQAEHFSYRPHSPMRYE